MSTPARAARRPVATERRAWAVASPEEVPEQARPASPEAWRRLREEWESEDFAVIAVQVAHLYRNAVASQALPPRAPLVTYLVVFPGYTIPLRELAYTPDMGLHKSYAAGGMA